MHEQPGSLLIPANQRTGALAFCAAQLLCLHLQAHAFAKLEGKVMVWDTISDYWSRLECPLGRCSEPPSKSTNACSRRGPCHSMQLAPCTTNRLRVPSALVLSCNSCNAFRVGCLHQGHTCFSCLSRCSFPSALFCQHLENRILMHHDNPQGAPRQRLQGT